MATSNATLNGTTAFSIFGQRFTWDNRRIDDVNVGRRDTGPTDTANLSLTGSNWRIDHMEFSGRALDVNITDSATGTGRIIQTLELADGATRLTLRNTEVRYILAQGNDEATIRLGARDVRLINMFDGDTDIFGGAGGVGAIRTGNGDNSFVGAGGRVNSIQFGSGSDVVRLGAGGAESVLLGSGNSTVVTGSGFVGAITAFSNTGDVNTITVGTGDVRSIGFSNGRDTLTVLAGASVEQVQLGSSADRMELQGDGNVGSATPIR
jgi:hypothetical protein